MAKAFFTIKITNIRDIAGVFRSMADEGAVEHARNLLRESGRIMVKELKEVAPVGEHYTFTGQKIEPAQRLRDSFFFKTFVRGKEVRLGVYVKPSQTDKLRWVILGTRPHKRGRREIRARRAKALAFWWARKNVSVVVKSVQHPGSIPNPFHEEALRRAEPALDKKTRQAARNIALDMFLRFPEAPQEVI